MLITCSICKELFLLSSEVIVTKCGHLYHEYCLNKWQERSVSCPQCRTKLEDECHRVYFDVEDPFAEPEDLPYIKQKLEDLTENLTDLQKENEDLKRINSNLKDEVSAFEQKEELARQTIVALKHKLNSLSREHQELNALKEDNTSLKAKISAMSKIEKLIQGSEGEVKNMLSKTPVTSLAVNQLCIYVQALKQQLKKYEEKSQREKAIFNIKYKAVVKKLREQKSANCKSGKVIAISEPLLEESLKNTSGNLNFKEESEIEEGCSIDVKSMESVMNNKEIEKRYKDTIKCNKKIINNVKYATADNMKDFSSDIEICQRPGSMKTLKSVIRENGSIFKVKKLTENKAPAVWSIQNNEVCDVWGRRRNPLAALSTFDEDCDINSKNKEFMKNRYRSTIPQGSSIRNNKCNFKTLGSYSKSSES